MRRTSSCPETGHLPLPKGARKLLLLPSPTKEKHERKKTPKPHQTSLTKEKEGDIKEIKTFFMHVSSA